MRVQVVTTVSGEADTLFSRLADVRAHLAVFPGVFTGGRIGPDGELSYRLLGVLSLVSAVSEIDATQRTVTECSRGAVTSRTEWRLRRVGPGMTEVTVASEFGPGGWAGRVLSRLSGPAFRMAARKLPRLDGKSLDRIAPIGSEVTGAGSTTP